MSVVVTSPAPARNLFEELRNPELYQQTTARIAKLLGHEQPAKDYRGAIKLLNTRYDLGFSPIEEEALGLLYLHTGAAAKRFSNDPYIDPLKGEDSAIHQAMCVPWAHEILRRAGSFEPGRFHSEEVNSFRRRLSLGVLLHDIGEIAREFSTVDDRGAGVSGGNKGVRSYKNLEVDVAEYAIKLAFLQLQRGASDWSFTDAISELRGKAGIRTGVPLTPEQSEKILAHLRDSSASLRIEELSGDYAQGAERFIAAYRGLETTPPDRVKSDRFLQLTGKLVERSQGTRHMTRNCEQSPHRGNFRVYIPAARWRRNVEDTNALALEHESSPLHRVPLDKAPSSKGLKAFAYNSSGVMELVPAASTEFERAVATETKRAALLTLAELVGKGPAYLDLSSPAPDPALNAEILKLRSLRKGSAEAAASAETVGTAIRTEQASLHKRHAEARAAGEASPIRSKSEVIRALILLAEGEVSIDPQQPVTDWLGSFQLPKGFRRMTSPQA